ncbi:MAG: hypothetical protein JST30_10945 [Armatimonadetes bacterium]|nr:hypothetical protein [Armatimonadota bacterium]
MAHEFEETTENKAPIGQINPDELQWLLNVFDGSFCDDLHASTGPSDDSVTVEAVAEATGRSKSEVLDALERLRAEDAERRLSLALRELEEPLHRVERPGHAEPDPLAQHFRMPKGQSLSPLLDDLARRSKAASKLSRKGKTQPPRFDLVGLMIMAVFTALTLVAVLYGLLHLPK